MTRSFSDLRDALRERLRIVADHELRDRDPSGLTSTNSRWQPHGWRRQSRRDFPRNAIRRAATFSKSRVTLRHSHGSRARIERLDFFLPRRERLPIGVQTNESCLSLLVLVATMNLARAGEFAGPPPFTNGFTLQSGTDGTYQAIASGSRDANLTGVFSFVIKGGLQTSDQSATINGWVFFVEGNIFQGSVTAAISRGSVIGVLNGGVTFRGVTTGEDGTLSLPTAFVVSGDVGSGEFERLNLTFHWVICGRALGGIRHGQISWSLSVNLLKRLFLTVPLFLEYQHCHCDQHNYSSG